MANNTGKKFGGREVGTPNRLTKELRTVLKEIVFKELEQLHDTMQSLEPKDKLELLIKILPFVLPKVDNIKSNSDEPIDFSW